MSSIGFKKRVAAGILALMVFELLPANGVEIVGPERHSKQLEYVESDGNEWVDTGLRLTNDMSVSITFRKVGTKVQSGIFGSRSGASKLNFSFGSDVQNGLFVDFNNSAYATYRAAVQYDLNETYRVEISSERRKIVRVSDGVVLTNNEVFCENEFSTASTALIFGVNGTTWSKAKIQLYSLVIRQCGEVIREYVPCELDGEARLFERVSGLYPAILGDGKLLSGPEKFTMPKITPSDKSAQIGIDVLSMLGSQGPLDAYAMYSPVEWGPAMGETFVGNDGASEGALNLSLTQDLSIDLTFSIESDEELTRNCGVFGARSAASENNISVLFYGSKVHADFNNSKYDDYRATWAPPSKGNRHEMIRVQVSSKARVISRVSDGTILAINTNCCNDTINTSAAKIFSAEGIGTSRGLVNVYALTIRRGDVIVRDYRPAVVDGVAGLFDCVTHTMVNSSSTDGFRSGSAVPTVEQVCAGIDSVGMYSATIEHPHLSPETEYHYSLFVTSGNEGGYACWPHGRTMTFTTLEKIKRGMFLLFR